MTSSARTTNVALPQRDRLDRWFPALALPAAVLLWGAALPPWVLAWLLTVAIYAGFKWLAFASSEPPDSGRRLPAIDLRRAVQFLFLWPGMDADAFLSSRAVVQPTAREVAFAGGNVVAGLMLIFGGVRLMYPYSAWLAGWIGLVGLAMFLLFGVAHLLSIAWRMVGVNAQPIMNRPHRASSLADFWGSRWNLAFHDIGRLFVFHPLRRRFGAVPAVVAVFLFSGIVHDLVMSVPVRSGLGWPTLYFLLQCGGVLFERSRFGKQLGLSRGWRSRLYAAAIVLLPLTWLFHDAFVLEIILPTLQWLGAC